jgi:hypothetical protein
MTKEELEAKGWELTVSNVSPIASWGKYMVRIKHTSNRVVAGYGQDEQQAIDDAWALASKEPVANEEKHR